MGYSSDIKKGISAQYINICSCGELHLSADSHIRRYAGRNDYQLIYVCEGQCVVTIDNSVQIAYPGDCILYRPGETQDYLLSKKDEPHTYWIHFNGELCGELFKTLGLQDVHIIKTENREIRHLASRICQYYNLQIPNRELICAGLMQSILALLSNELHKQTHPAQGNDKISELISRIKMTSSLNITVSECAQFCNMSKVHFIRVFKRTTGLPPMQFMLRLRIDRAKELLDFTDNPIAEIAEASGFSDQNYFARTFKQFTGMSPTQFRKERKNTV